MRYFVQSLCILFRMKVPRVKWASFGGTYFISQNNKKKVCVKKVLSWILDQILVKMLKIVVTHNNKSISNGWNLFLAPARTSGWSSIPRLSSTLFFARYYMGRFTSSLAGRAKVLAFDRQYFELNTLFSFFSQWNINFLGKNGENLFVLPIYI